MQSTSVDVWGRVLSEVQQLVGPQRFGLWFKNLELIKVDGHLVEIGTPNLFIQEWLENRFLDVIVESFRKVTGQAPTVSFRVAGNLFRQMRAEQLETKAELLPATEPAAVAQLSSDSLPVRKDMTLDDFVVGPCNIIAYAGASRVASGQKPIYNPLFIHGSGGLGKTHLLHAICNAFTSKKSGASIVYVSGEAFTNQFLLALRNSALEPFRQRYRTVDVFVVDDVHFLARARATQEEFLHTFNALDGSGKQIVLASSAHPRQMGKLSESLVDRFLSGMVARLEPPDVETRLSILQAKARRLQRKFPRELLEYMASTLTGNVRELEGAITTIAAYAALSNADITLELAKETLRDLAGVRISGTTLRDVHQEVASHFGVRPSDLKSRSRARQVALPRQISMYLARKLTTASYPEIGSFFDRDHATAIKSAQKIEALVKNDREFAGLIELLSNRIRQRGAGS